mmetsp:Transcript_2218/g.6184  ORF Transcript_2218/g.6184 Transcript_2218/m.6184 type:complete len:207 (-) Transcript_2218:76-696(-)
MPPRGRKKVQMKWPTRPPSFERAPFQATRLRAKLAMDESKDPLPKPALLRNALKRAAAAIPSAIDERRLRQRPRPPHPSRIRGAACAPPSAALAAEQPAAPAAEGRGRRTAAVSPASRWGLRQHSQRAQDARESASRLPAEAARRQLLGTATTSRSWRAMSRTNPGGAEPPRGLRGPAPNRPRGRLCRRPARRCACGTRAATCSCS